MSARPVDTSAHRRKRVHFATDTSSSPSISDSSTLALTSVADDSTAASDYGSDSGSSLSESSEEPSSESSSEDDDDDSDAASDDNLEEHKGRNGVVSLRAGQGKKPTMRLDKDELGPDIRTFLKDFLPQLKAANDELEKQQSAGTLKGQEIDAVEGNEGEPYIEMDLGLGVLEEKSGSPESDSDENMEDAEKEKDVLGKLMGRAATKEEVVIQEVQEKQAS